MSIAIRETLTQQDSQIREPARGEHATTSSAHQQLSFRTWFRKPWVLASLGAIAVVVLLGVGIEINQSARHTKLRAYAAPQTELLNSSTVDANASVVPSPAALPQLRKAPNARSEIVGAAAGSTPTSGPMIARSVSLTILVKDFQNSRTALDTILSQHHGYPAQLTANTPENSSRNLQASLRIPAPELAAALKDLRALGRVQSESQSGEEVSQQHADIVARLKNSRESEERLRAILQQRTGKIEDVLQVEEEIARVRGEIEGMESEQKALEHRVDFASVDLQLAEQYTAQLNPQTESIVTRIHNASVAGYGNALAFVLAIVLFSAQFGPTLLILLLILGVPAFFIHRRYRKIIVRD